MHITLDAVRTELWEIIERQGEDYQYSIPGDGSTCLYSFDGAPSCLIGHYLVDLGVPVEAFSEHDVEAKEVDDLFIDGFLARYGITADPEAIQIMSSVQFNQDAFYSWGESYRRAFEFYEED